MPIPHLSRRPSNSWKTANSENPQSRNRKNRRPWWKKLIKPIITLALLWIVVFAITVAWVSRDLPNPNQLINRDVAQSTKIYDRTGENIIYEISGEQRRTLIPLQDLPPYVKQATIAIEDKNFYKHGGFSLWAMFRTVITNVIYHRSAGGSTLTQQFIKNAVLSSEKTITRKIKELILAYRLEKKFSKDEILQMYLNEIPYGSNAYGIEAASQKYFGKSVKNISLAEAATLAALTQSPSRYSPYGPNKDLLLGRKDYVLDLMAEQGYISTTEKEAAKKEVLAFKGRDNNMTAPHFVMYIKDILAEKYGEKTVEQGGLKIYTTLDLYKQKIAEEVVVDRTKDYATKNGANNASLVALDPKTGQILAMVGSRDYFDDSIDGQVNVALRPRQPGSSMKPIVYAALFEKGFTPDTILYDVVTNFSTDPSQPYEPHNYDGKERGPISIRKALAGSLNVPAVKAIYLAGVNNVIDLAENLGYSTLYPRDRFGLALVLGGAEVKLLEHTNAYSAFARDGQISPIVSILKIEDKDGKILEEYKPSDKKVLDSQIARMINSVLSDNAARTYIFGEKNFLTLGDRPVAAKTGTTNDYHDAWTIGYTPSLVAGVWVGNNNNKAMKGKADGSVLAAPIWHDFMARVLGGTPAESFKAPDDYKTGKPILDGEIPTQTFLVDISSGLLATSSTPPELINELKIPVSHSILYYVNKDDPKGPVPQDPAQDPQFNLWETAVQKWATKNASNTLINIPAGYDSLHTTENKPTISILSPSNNSIVDNTSLSISLEAAAARGVSRLEYYLNNNLWQIGSGGQKNFNGQISFLNNGYHTLRVRACDDVDNCSDAAINFNLAISGNPVSAGKNSITLSIPKNSLKTSDFPLKINISINNPVRTAKIRIFANDSNGQSALVANVDNISGKNLETEWVNPPTSGQYSLYAELNDWNGDVIDSNNEAITVNN